MQSIVCWARQAAASKCNWESQVWHTPSHARTHTNPHARATHTHNMHLSLATQHASTHHIPHYTQYASRSRTSLTTTCSPQPAHARRTTRNTHHTPHRQHSTHNIHKRTHRTQHTSHSTHTAYQHVKGQKRPNALPEMQCPIEKRVLPIDQCVLPQLHTH